MPRTNQDNARLRDTRRAAILAAALRVFVDKGLPATRISDIAEAAGVAQGLLYHYFRTKEAVYVELVRGAFAGINRAVEALEEMPRPPHEKIELAVRELLRLLDRDESFARTFMLTAQASLFAGAPRQVVTVIRRQRHQPYLAIARILRAGQAEGTIVDGDADELAVVFWTSIKGLAMHRAVFGRAFVAPDPRLLLRLFVREKQR